MEEATAEEIDPSRQKRKSRIQSLEPNQAILTTPAWKCGVTLLELLQNRKKLDNSHLFVPPLFDILKKCLDFQEQSAVEYAKQMVLSLILQCCQKITSLEKTRRHLLPDNVFKVNLIVQCIRGTQNPQTHHHAMILLAHVAGVVPEQVLHNMMDIFTFVGSTIVRQDDAYGFQIIAKIIDSIIPILVNGEHRIADERQAQVIPILKVFADIILDIPEHRRNPLYVKLIQTLNATDYLWIFLCVLFESDVVKGTVVEKDARVRRETDQTERLSKRIEIALAICFEFEPIEILETCKKMIEYVQDLPFSLDKDKSSPFATMDSDVIATLIFSQQGHTNKHLRHFRYNVLRFIPALISSPQIINKIAVLSDEETLSMKRYYQLLIIAILTYIPELARYIEKAEDPRLDYWKILLNHCYEILESTIALLSSDVFIVVVHGLMDHKLPAVVKKVVEVLNNKLQYQKDYFTDNNNNNMLCLFEGLMKIITENIISTPSYESATLVQSALLSIKLLAKILTEKFPQKVKEILIILVEILSNFEKIPNENVVPSLLLCITELISNLKAHSLVVLSKFMPTLIKILKNQNSKIDVQTSSILTSLLRIIEILPLFLSPYLIKIIMEVSKIYAKIIHEPKKDSKITQNETKMKMIWEKLATYIAPRVLIPAIDSSYVELIHKNQLKAIEPLMMLLSQSFISVKSAEFQAIQSELTQFFLKALQFRCDNSGNSEIEDNDVDEAEKHVIKAFVNLILKLSESSFRPLFFKVYDWSIRDTATNDRAITFFCLSGQISGALKSLFVLFASDLIKNAAEMLETTNISKVGSQKSLFFPDLPEKNVTLIKYILETLHGIFLHDNQNFMTALRFDTLMQPMVDQLDNLIIFENQEVRKLVACSLAQLAVAVKDDMLWKQLNYQILLKTRSNAPEIRLFALEACVEFVKKIGEDFSPLLPEAIPFLAELLEDENYEVESGVQKAIQEIEKITGESLQKYF